MDSAAIISQFVEDTSYDDLPAAVTRQAKRSLVDVVAAIHSGIDSEVSQRVLRWSSGKTFHAGPVPVPGTPYLLTPDVGALVLGTMAHATDFDDVSSPLRGHTSAVVFPALFASTAGTRITGSNFLRAFVLGSEMMIRLGSALNPEHSTRGWHVTSTVGVIGAAVAASCASTVAGTMANAIGIATSMASGVQANFGTMVKPLHCGIAARNGITASELAAEGIDASPTIIDGVAGFSDVFAGRTGPPVVSDARDSWYLAEPGLELKRYPCCYATHRLADAAEHLSVKSVLDLEDIDRIEAVVPQGGLLPLKYPSPTNGLQGKFSGQYVISSMLLDGEITDSSFTDSAVNRRDAQLLARKVHLREDPDIPQNRAIGDIGYVEIAVHNRSGLVTEQRIYSAKGSARNPMSDKELRDKFENCLSPHHSEDRIQSIYETIMHLEDLSTVEVLAEAMSK